MGSRLAVAVLIAALLALPIISASGNSVVSVDLEIEQNDESVQIDVILHNSGDSATSIDTDPSCDAYLKILNSQEELIRDYSNECRGQTRGMDISAGETVQFDSLSWDYYDGEGVEVPSGVYEVIAVIAEEGFSSSAYITVVKPIQVADDLEFTFSLTQRDTSQSGGPLFLTTNLVNTGTSEIDLSDMPWCMVVIDGVNSHSCNSDRTSISPHEVILISHQRLSISSDSISVEIPGVFSDTLDVSTSNSNSIMSEALELEIIPGENGFDLSEDNYLQTQVRITNTGTSDEVLSFSDSCRAELWMIDIAGNVVMDSRFSRECSDVSIEYLIEPAEEVLFNQPDWAFIDLQGCSLPTGTYTLFAEIPEYGAITSQEIYWTNTELNCDSWEEIPGEIAVDIDSNSISVVIGNDVVEDLTWTSPCRYFFEIYNDENSIEWWDGCDERSGMRVRTHEPHIESSYFSLLDEDGKELPSGVYQVSVETSSAPSLHYTTTFDWNVESAENEQDNTEETEEVIVDEEDSEQRILVGIWQQHGECWALDSREEGLVTFSSSAGIPNWAPRAGWLGQYSVVDTQEVAPGCESSRTGHIAIKKVHSETPPLAESEEETVEKSDTQSTAIEVPQEVGIAVGAVATTGFLALLVMFVAGNESWRMPVTGAGLWLLGLIGRTSETSDGRYQRGRLMGYLTANPGCHFRALMAALSMSNGQITHHLKILEEEDKIWRRKDGRLVRFYPLTAELNPDVSDNELPLPPLSPDPNSLQGKILRLLDDDGQLDEFPTQAELAHRLERSQQLISHHLRTLQKYGLVEKKRMGIKQRYSLTKEAIFLLDSNEF